MLRNLIPAVFLQLTRLAEPIAQQALALQSLLERSFSASTYDRLWIFQDFYHKLYVEPYIWRCNIEISQSLFQYTYSEGSAGKIACTLKTLYLS
jgi:hypothetical protein